MRKRLIIRDFKQFGGKHCETSSFNKILEYHGFHFSEEMLFGLGGGIGFIYWYMKKMPYPFIGGRNGKYPYFLYNAARRIGAKLTLVQSASIKKAYGELKNLLSNGEPVIVYGDIAFLPYFASNIHFGGHAFVVFGLDETKREVYISDNGRKSIVISICDLEKARCSKFPPFIPRQSFFKVKYPSGIKDLKNGIRAAIKDCCISMLKPPIKSFGLTGIEKWSDTIMTWSKTFKREKLFDCLMGAFINIEIAGTGGSAFRNMYLEFLKEANYFIGNKKLSKAIDLMTKSAKLWNEISKGFLPDSSPLLARTRELLIKKNKHFKEQKPGALNAMQEINIEIAKLRSKSISELKKAPIFLADVKQNIRKCYTIENEVFNFLSVL